MEAKRHVHGENMKLLKEIYNLKSKLNEMYIQNGPNSSDYINLSIKLNVLEKKYMEEKLIMYQEVLGDGQKQQETKQALPIEKYHRHERKTDRQQKSPVWHVLVNR